MQATKQYLWALLQMLGAVLLIAAAAAVAIRSVMALYDGYAIGWAYHSTAVMAYKTLALVALAFGFLALVAAAVGACYFVFDHAMQSFAYGHYLTKGGHPQWFKQWQQAPDLYAHLAFPAHPK